jgi:hypothetical protein
MDETNKACGCTCICDPTVARVLDQTSSRYNDRSAFANNNQQDAVTQLNSMFTARAQQSLQNDVQSNIALAILAQRSTTNQPGA